MQLAICMHSCMASILIETYIAIAMECNCMFIIANTVVYNYTHLLKQLSLCVAIATAFL